MQEFLLYLTLGFDHIVDLKGYDHLLFVMTLCAGYPALHWRKIALLISAFTLGHCLTLLLSAFEIIRFSPTLVEVLIPATILLTAIFNLFRKSDSTSGISVQLSYFIAAMFGLIHGMGFSTYFKALLGGMGSIIFPLFSFNLGIEFGQLLIVAVFFVASYLIVRISQMKQHDWQLFISGMGAGGAILMMLERV